jgi:hypothetical protein
MTVPPEPELQVQFLFNIQRLLSDGRSVATHRLKRRYRRQQR